MRLTVRLEDETRRGTAEQLEAADQALRQSFSGFAVDAVEAEVRRSLDEIGLDLSIDEVRGYAEAIAERADFVITLD